jgi:hypothetical protein
LEKFSFSGSSIIHNRYNLSTCLVVWGGLHCRGDNYAQWGKNPVSILPEYSPTLWVFKKW